MPRNSEDPKIENAAAYAIEALAMPAIGSTQGNNAYYVSSTATINVEDDLREIKDGINLTVLAKQIIDSKNLVIAIHGYSVPEKSARSWFAGIYAYINGGTAEKESTKCIKNSVFVGYRWPSENRQFADNGTKQFPVAWDKVQDAFQALPNLLFGLLLTTFVVGVVAYALLTQSIWVFVFLMAAVVAIAIYFINLGQLRNDSFIGITVMVLVVLGLLLYLVNRIPAFAKYWPLEAGLIMTVMTFVGSLVVALIVLRLTTYFRDRFRASNYGVLDLVELIRDLDAEIQAQGHQKPDIKLSFIAHSLGCEVLTQAVRVLSDVFDPDAMRQEPDGRIGQVFSLSRLVLVAPDIPIESILPGRANFLKSSLRRFDESYIFSNEGDIVLRLASTAANYMSFPAKTRMRSYKLGNVAVAHFSSSSDSRGNKPQYGIVPAVTNEIQKSLEVRGSSLEHCHLAELYAGVSVRNAPRPPISWSVTEGFTYFDCTDYRDLRIDYAPGDADQHFTTNDQRGVVSHAEGKPALNFPDYLKLILCTGKSGSLEQINPHGGYFKGKFSQDLIYGLAFLGYQDFLTGYFDGFQGLAAALQERQIQAILAAPRLRGSASANHP